MNVVSDVPQYVSIQNVLLSVSDKTGIVEFVQGLLECNPSINLFSTGGTYKCLHDMLERYNGGSHLSKLKQVSEYTGQAEMQGGLVKTLDYRIYLGLLSEPYNDFHHEDIRATDSIHIDMAVVNLYPFSKQVSTAGSTLEDARSHIDIGGPTMLRASAKNYIRVTSVCNPEDYPQIIEHLRDHDGAINLDLRFDLAKKTFAHTAQYDAGITEYLSAKHSTDLKDVYELRDENWKGVSHE